ncbi:MULTISPECIES: pantetheine-phosphate adenylyltransferase [Campylobacter]|uniref:pantetheine-phosphate adenylyltransferase n=1 Tax=Campylobacter TaxID=194 RepID=UPI0023F02C69|nr:MULTISPECIES: pantetheine-phosphate adenylyltransferase [Campylobacter]MCI6642160.1 pantetheine-phosphate adenylyltransferase [Campylobacter sp.]MDD7422271.1 pantetheine-phosphate adenylyltransferase [Campylobacter hominis]MDY3116694.1 pantetheine-phosphate adenylyltransferase [Campylobacter hominis]
MRTNCMYPGTFDPITNGHLDVIKRALRIFDNVIVAVAKSDNKKPFFELDKRVEMVKEATKSLENIEVMAFENLLVDFVKSQDTCFVIRGLRAVSDFEYELQLGYANRSLWDKFETIYLMPTIKYSFISSSIVRSIFEHGGDISHLVPKEILPFLEDKKC